MNGRLYDPKLHRFLQTDNYVQDPGNTQNYNRYGYVLNNPLKYTDPSGWLTQAEEKEKAQKAEEDIRKRGQAMADWYAENPSTGANGSSSWLGRRFGAIGRALGITTPDLPGTVLDEVVIQGKARSAQGGGGSGNSSSSSGSGGFLDHWNDVNNINDRIVSPVLGIFEGGAIRTSSTISTTKAFNRIALAETIANAKFLKVAGNISRVGNALGVGYAAVIAYQDPSKSNIARAGAQIAIIGIEMGVNAFVPGLGFVVGFGLSAFESSDYVQDFYKGLDK